MLVAIACSVSCGDPTREKQIDALGPETPGVHEGPLHRPGQPCLVCHDGNGPGDAVFSMAGTVYKQPDSLDPLPDAIVRMIDSEERRYATATNCAGNFFVGTRDFLPAYPVWLTIEFGGAETPMNSPIFRQGSCAPCHYDPVGPSTAGHVYFAPIPVDFPASNCP